ncbi:MAG: DegT/DnrJ/EryC1/StrS family aminotransferase [Salinispira sp.]
MAYQLAHDSWDNKEIEAIHEVVRSGRYTMGTRVKTFEKEFAKFLGCAEAVMVNSESSANLLMLAVLSLKYKLKGNIIVPAVSWSTTYVPVHQYGFTLNFVDINSNTLNIDVDKVESAITSETSAIFAVNLLGNSCKFKELKKIAGKYDLMLIKDNCESFGAISDTGEYTGTIGCMGSFSFFFSHHLQTMEGGMIACRNNEDAQFLRSLRAHGWVRDLPEKNTVYNKTGIPFKDHFLFVIPGYCVRPLEMSGAIGSAQLRKWPLMKAQRLKNAEYFTSTFEDFNGIRIQKEIGTSSWFGFSMVFTGKLTGKRDVIVRKFAESDIECRPIVAGNFMRNPAMEYLNYIDNQDYDVADYIHENGLFIGNDSRSLQKNLDMVYTVLTHFG